MKKIIKMVYEAPFVEIVPYVDDLLEHNALSHVKYGDEVGGITPVDDDDDPQDDLNLSKDWDFGDYDSDFNW